MNEIIFDDKIPTYIRQNDFKAGVSIGIPWKSRTRLSTQQFYFNNFDRYLNDYTLNNKDTLDVTMHEGISSGITLDNYDLDKKMYPTKGTAFSFGVKYFYDEESHRPGSSSLLKEKSFTAHNWLKVKFKYEQYVPVGKKYNLGYLAEGVFSSQPVLRNYTSTLIASPAFSPMQDSKTLFLENYRGFYYIAGGIKNIIKFNSRLQCRAEAFFFQRFNSLETMPNQEVRSVLRLEPIRFCGNVNLVYFTPFGPLSISGLYYDDPRRSYGVLLHVGYILFNNRSWD
jgi:NTE family protein